MATAAASSDRTQADHGSQPKAKASISKSISLTDVAPSLACALLFGGGVLAGMALRWPHSATLPQLAALKQPKHAVMTVSDFNGTVQWYEDKLGFVHLDVPSQDGRTARVLLVGSRNIIEIRHAAGSDASMREGAANVRDIALQLDNVDAETAELKQRGVEVVAEPRISKERNLRVSLIRDLNGRTIELQGPFH